MAWYQISLILWKNLLLARSRKTALICQVILPILFILITYGITRNSETPAKIYSPFCPARFSDSNCKAGEKSLLADDTWDTIVYSPQNDLIDSIMINLGKILEKKMKGFSNSKKLENHFSTAHKNHTLAGIQFDEDLTDKTELPVMLTITFRFLPEMHAEESFLDFFLDKKNWLTNMKTSPENEVGSPRDPDRNEGAVPYYSVQGFLGLQQVVAYLLILSQQNKLSKDNVTSTLSGYNSMPEIKMERFPHSKLKLSSIDGQLFAELYIMAYAVCCGTFTSTIVKEKEHRIKEALKINNLHDWSNLLAWCISGMLEFSITGLLIYAAHVVNWSGVTALCRHSSKLFIALLLFMIQAYFVIICLVVSTWFSKGVRAGLVCGFLILLLNIPFTLLSKRKKISTIMIISFLPSSGVSFLLNQIYVMEAKAIGARFSTVWKVVTVNNYTLGYGILIILFEMLLFILLYLYMEATLPREYGVPRPWNFLCMQSYWTGKPDTSDEEVHSEIQAQPARKEANFIEDDPKNMSVGVEVKELKKVFNGEVAVNGVSFKMFENQVTVLLGPNGAGKSTIIAMIVGVLRPTSGTAILNSYDIMTQQQKARQYVGICPQFNMMYATLTVEEHLKLFCKLRRVTNVATEVAHYLEATKLTEKRQHLCRSLSGGMKRRLCIALAFCANTKVVLLDEPTSGVDTTLRRDIWDLIANEKQGRTILLTTHFMDEAEILGDRIVIIAEGEIKCSGSSFFLKKRYDTGYQLVIEKAPKCNPAEVTSFLSNYITKVKIHTDAGTKLTYVLSEQYVDNFPGMLRDLDKSLDRLRIRSYGIELATMEEVFLKVGTRGNIEIAQTQRKAPGESDKKVLLTGLALMKQQYQAMLMKKLMSVYGSKLLHLFIIFSPTLFLLLNFITMLVTPHEELKDLPAWKFSLSHYDEPTILIETVESPNKYESSFRSVILDNKGALLDVPDVRDFILEKSEEVPNQEFKYLYGTRFETSEDLKNDKVKLWFNNFHYHTPGLGMQLVLDAIYKKELGMDHGLQFINYPSEFDLDTKIERMEEAELSIQGSHRSFTISFTLLVLFYITERVINSKHLQVTMGLNRLIFWSSAYMIDLLICLVTVLIFLVVVVSFRVVAFKDFSQLATLGLVLILFSAAYLTRVYLASLLFSSSLLAYIILLLLSVIEGLIYLIVMVILIIRDTDVDVFSKSWQLLFSVFGLSEALRSMESVDTTYRSCDQHVKACEDSGKLIAECKDIVCEIIQDCCSWKRINFNYKGGINYCLWGFIISAVVGWIIILFIELRGHSWILKHMMSSQRVQSKNINDQDVAEEKFKIKNTPREELIKDNAIVLDSLCKRFSYLYAVKDLNLTISSSECFGLLGTNGAGKTTTFKILTGEITLFGGDGWIHGYNIRNQMRQIRNHISYCPQFDALIESLTVRQTLMMYSLIRGIPSNECKELIENLAKDFDFYQYLHKKICQLSGGNKRKVSSSVALIGDPDIVYMDEPTTGMDVGTRRHLWNQIITAYASGKCIILTTHSMEESEALCTRVGIMVNGELICLGAIQHLKHKFVKGCTITLKVTKDADIGPVDTFIKANFPMTTFVDQHQQLLTYSVEGQMSWSDMFRFLQKAKSDRLIQDYTIAQPSLEQVFLMLTKNQRTIKSNASICC